MKRHLFQRINPAIFFAAADDRGGGGGDDAPKTLAEATEKMTAMRTEITQAKKEATDAKTAQATAESEAKRQQGLADTAITEAKTAKEQLATAQGQIATLTGERDKALADHKTAAANCTRLEALCGVKGLDPNAAPPSIADNANGQHVYDQWQKATGGEKTRLWRAHEPEIRAEAERRSKRG